MSLFGFSSFTAVSAFSLLPLRGSACIVALRLSSPIFSGVFYRRLGCFYRRLGCFYRHIVGFFLAYIRFFLYLCSIIIKSSVMVQFYIPIPVCDIPEPICGARGQFRVFYMDGHIRDFFGRIGSISLLREALVARVSRDASIGSVWLYLPSGRLLLCCGKF